MKQLKELREKNNLSKADFALKVGIPASTLSKYENGSLTPDVQVLTKISLLFGVSIDWLLFGDEVPLPSDILEVPFITDDGTNASAGKIIKLHINWLRANNISSENLLIMKVTGDAMFPTFRSGDMLVVDTEQIAPVPDKLYMVRFEEGTALKRCGEKRDNMLTLHSDNKLIPPVTVDLSLGSLYIAGRVVWCGRQM